MTHQQPGPPSSTAAGLQQAVSAIVARYRDALEAEMRAIVPADDTLLAHMMRYHLGWEDATGAPGAGAGGKTLRPALCLLACEATHPLLQDGAGLGVGPALPAAAAIEFIHNFSLVHDDIQDQDVERHHRPTVWALWGVPQAINAGDGLWALAIRAFLRMAERGVPPAIVLRALGMLNDACMSMIEGQSLDLAFEQAVVGGPPVQATHYLDMIGRKTGALIATTLAIGALIGSRDEEVAARYFAFGVQLGRVYQVQDDILGIWGKAELTGKSTSSDIRRKKQSYPVVYTLSQGPAEARAALAAVYALPEIDDEAVTRAVRALEDAGARAHAAQLTATAHARACELLDALPAHPRARADLRAITDFLLTREF
jgi:geranylgeranyl diphosphate synthase type I